MLSNKAKRRIQSNKFWRAMRLSRKLGPNWRTVVKEEREAARALIHSKESLTNTDYFTRRLAMLGNAPAGE